MEQEVQALVIDNGSGMCKVRVFVFFVWILNFCVFFFFQKTKSISFLTHVLILLAINVGWFCRRWCATSGVSVDCWTTATHWCDGRNGSEGLVCWRRSAVEAWHSDAEISDRARHRDELGWYGEDLASHVLQRVASCARRTSSSVDWSTFESKGIFFVDLWLLICWFVIVNNNYSF